MNTKTIIAAVALALGSASSFADTYAWRVAQIDQSPSTLTREQVRAELERADAAGQPSGFGYTVRAAATAGATEASSGLTREQVKAELVAAQKNGEMPLGGFGARSLRDIYPDLYRAAPASGVAHAATAVNVN